MVIEFPSIDLGGAPSTEGSAPEDGAAFASLVDGLLADPSDAPDEAEGGPDDADEPPPGEMATALFMVQVGPVPATDPHASGDSADLAAALESAPGTADEALAALAAGADPNAPGPGAGQAAMRGHVTANTSMASGPHSVATASADPSSSSQSQAVAGVFAEAGDETGSTVPTKGSLFSLAGPDSLSSPPAVEVQAQANTSSTPAGESAAPEAPPVDTSDRTRALRKDAHNYFERAAASAADAASTDTDTVERVAAHLESGLDLGSSAREGSRDGGSQTPSPSPVPSLMGTTAASPALGSPQATWVPASPSDDVVLPQLVRAMRLQLVGGVGEARIQLDPKHLGAVTVNLRVEGGVVSAVVTAEQSAVRQWIEQHEMSLRQALAQQGLMLDRLHVERDGRPPEERASDGQDGPPRRRAPRKDTATFELLA